MPEGNVTAALALLLLIPAAVLAFSIWRPSIATAVVLLGAILFLPERSCFDAPMVPALDKCRIAVLCCAFALTGVGRREAQKARILRGKDWLVLASLPLAQLVTVLTNLDAGPHMAVPIPPTEVFSVVLAGALDVTGPFLLGRLVYRTASNAHDLLKALSMCGLAYVPFIIVEIKAGPIFHPAVYGFLQHSLAQTIRGDGFRPMVFMAHGLALAVMMFAATAASVIIARSERSRILGVPAWIVAVGLVVLFPFIKSSAALLYLAVAVFALVAFNPKAQANLAFGVICAVWCYIALRICDWFPTWKTVDLLARLGLGDRAGSLGFRFYSEDVVLARALERPIFGWGGWGRGTAGAIVDGAWIGILSGVGLVGLLLNFGLTSLPIVVARRRLGRADPSAQPVLSGLSVVLALTVIDLLPNGLFNNLQAFLAGALTGLAWGIPDERKRSFLPQLLSWWRTRRRHVSQTHPMQPRR